MGKGTDKNYITHSEWSNDFSDGGMSFGGARTAKATAPVKLAFDCCQLSFQPVVNPVCTRDGHVFDKANLVEWLSTHSKINPVSGKPLDIKQVIPLKFHADPDSSKKEYICPITKRTLTNSSHIVAIATSGNVYSYDAVKELNINMKHWFDLLNDKIAFEKSDIITLQDPQNPPPLNETFYHVKMGVAPEKLVTANINPNILASRIYNEIATTKFSKILPDSVSKPVVEKSVVTPAQATIKSTGRTAASFTSSTMNLQTKTEVVNLSLDEVMYRDLTAHYMNLRKKKGSKILGNSYVQMKTNLGDLNFEIFCILAPRTSHNFLTLCSRGYYDNVIFHRSIPNFMIQGGDPTGTGKGGESIFGTLFQDEIRPSMHHNARGILSMANRGKNTNGSQFFITFGECTHLDGKHTVFGKLVGGAEVLDKMEAVSTDKNDRPLSDLIIRCTKVYRDPFSTWEKDKEKERVVDDKSRSEKLKDEGTWLVPRFKRERTDNSDEIGKYLPATSKPKN